MSSQTVTDILVLIAAPGATLLPLLYAIVAKPWRRGHGVERQVGIAFLITKCGFAGLCDGALVFRWFGPDYPFHDTIILGSFSLIVLGTYLYLIALVRAQILMRRDELAASPAFSQSQLKEQA